MTKTEQFLMLVQTAVIIESRTETDSMSPRSGKAAHALHCAMKVSEDELPDHLDSACGDLIEYIFYGGLKPNFLLGKT